MMQMASILKRVPEDYSFYRAGARGRQAGADAMAAHEERMAQQAKDDAAAAEEQAAIVKRNSQGGGRGLMSFFGF
jgi:hypothetical protein